MFTTESNKFLLKKLILLMNPMIASRYVMYMQVKKNQLFELW